MPIEPFDLYSVRYARFDNITTATITKETGISKRIIDIWIDSCPDKTYMDVNVGTTRVARIPLKWGDVILVSEPESSLNDISTLQFLAKLFPEFTIEGDQDEDITFQFNNTIPTLHVTYVVQKAGIDKTKLGRSACPNLIYACPITHSEVINATKNYSLDTCLYPVGFPEIKDGFIVPSGRQLILKALAFGSAIAGATTPARLHVWDERTELFTPIGHEGVSVASGKNLLAANIVYEDIVKVKDYVIPAGHKLALNFDASYDGTNTLAAQSAALFLLALWQAVK
jgi:hypothetical protein